MSEPHLSNWDAVRDSLKIPTKNRYEAIHLTDQKIAKHLEVSAAALKQLYELYEIDDVYPGVKELRALIKQVAEKVSVPTPNTDVPRTGGLEIGGGHSQAEKENIHAVLDRERWALQTILDDIAAHANTHEARLSQLNELIAPNEAREKRELEAFKKQQAGAAAERARRERTAVFIAQGHSQAEAERMATEPFESFLSLELPQQFEREIGMLERAGLIENGGIIGIDGKFYAVPTLDDVLRRANEKREILQEKFKQGFTRLQIIPFALPLSKFHAAAERAVKEHHANKKLFAPKKSPTDPDEQLQLDTNEPVWRWNDLKGADTNQNLKYYPDKFDPEQHGGKTKQVVITSGLHGITNGFQFQLVEDDVNIPRAGANITIGGRTRIEAGKTGHEYLANIGTGQYAHESGRTYEAWYTRLLSQLNEKDEVIDDWQGNGSASLLTGNYMPASGGVGVAYWNRGNRRAEVGWRSPGFGWRERSVLRGGILSFGLCYFFPFLSLIRFQNCQKCLR